MDRAGAVETLFLTDFNLSDLIVVIDKVDRDLKEDGQGWGCGNFISD